MIDRFVTDDNDAVEQGNANVMDLDETCDGFRVNAGMSQVTRGRFDLSFFS